MRDEITGGSGQERGRQRAGNPLKYFAPPKSYRGEIMLINEMVDEAFRRPGKYASDGEGGYRSLGIPDLEGFAS